MSAPKRRDNSRSIVTDVVCREAPITREAIGERTGLSKATVARIVDDLRTHGVLIDGPIYEGEGRGRPSTGIDISKETGFVVGVDFGQRTVRFIVGDLRGRTISEHSYATPDSVSGKEAATFIAERVRYATAKLIGNLRALAVGVPGRVNERFEIYRSGEELSTMDGSGLYEGLNGEFDVSVILDSDANMALLGEISAGEIDGSGDAVLLSLSTGFNSAQSQNGYIRKSRSESFGNIGSLYARESSVPLENYLSVKGLSRLLPVSEGNDASQVVESLWRDVDRHNDIVKKFRESVVDIVTIFSVVSDPSVIIFSGRLYPLINALLPSIVEDLNGRLPAVPDLRMTTLRGFAGAQGSLHAAVNYARRELTQSVSALQRTHRNALQNVE